MATGTITKERALAAGMTLQSGQISIAEAEEMRKLHGDTVASLYRVQALNEFRKALDDDDVKALIISAADHSYEVAESDKFRLTTEQKLKGAVMAMMKGCLLSDEAGPHFAVICGKGGISVLIKEAGHRHKLRRRGVRNIDVKSVARMIRKRPNADGKYDMIVDGEASCELNGEVFTVTRKGDMPIVLPCYETDGPDGHEAKARRRLLRDLWAKVSGEFDPIETAEIETEFEQPPVEVIEHKATEKPDTAANDPEGVPTEAYWKHQWNTAAKTVGHTAGDPHVLITLAMAIRDATTVEQLNEAISDAKQNVGKEKYQFSQKFLIRLQEYRDWRADQMIGVA